MDEGEALVEAKRGRIGTCEWRNLVSLLDRFWNEVRISLMRIPCMHAELCKLYFGWERGSKTAASLSEYAK